MLGDIRKDDKGGDLGAVVSFERTLTGWKQSKILPFFDAKPGAVLSHYILIVVY